MFARVLVGAGLVAGVLLGAVTVVAVPGAAMGCVVFGIVVAAPVGKRLRDIAPGEAAVKARTGVRGGLLAGAVAAVASLALIGLILLFGPASGAMLLALTVGTFAVWLWRQPDRGAALRTNPLPAVLGRVLRVAQERVAPPRTVTPPPERQAVAAAPVAVPADLSVPQLCLAWQRTYFALLDLPAGTSRAAIVRLRIGLLDEIERRDPEGFTRWLDTGARAGGDPSRYLAGDR